MADAPAAEDAAPNATLARYANPLLRLLFRTPLKGPLGKQLAGRQVNVALRGGGRIDGCQLVSAGCREVSRRWLFTDGADTFVRVEEVLEVWEAAV